jgi:hypothetical protein
MTDPQIILGVIATTLSILGVMELRVRNLVKHYLAELKPNGGSSTKDQITRVENRLDDLYKHLLEK